MVHGTIILNEHSLFFIFGPTRTNFLGGVDGRFFEIAYSGAL